MRPELYLVSLFCNKNGQIGIVLEPKIHSICSFLELNERILDLIGKHIEGRIIKSIKMEYSETTVQYFMNKCPATKIEIVLEY